MVFPHIIQHFHTANSGLSELIIHMLPLALLKTLWEGYISWRHEDKLSPALTLTVSGVEGK